MKHFLLLAVITAVLALPALAQPQSTFNTSLTLAPADAQSSSSGAGGDEQAKAAELARKLQNPVAALISVPIQNNWDFGIGPANAMRYPVVSGKLAPALTPVSSE